MTAVAYFNVWQRHAAEDVGLNMLHIINDTIAAATAHGLDKKSDRGCIVLMYDMGSGNFEVSHLTNEDALFSGKGCGG